MKKLFHEMPLNMLLNGYEDQLTDGHYALVHLYEESVPYFSHTLKTLEQGREVILDNSIFELEKAFDADRFAYWIEQIASRVGAARVDEKLIYIIPDVLDNMEGTIASAQKFLDKYRNKLPGKKMAVAQGKTYAELIQCYHELSTLGMDRIGISFNCEAYNGEDSGDKLRNWCKGRISLISMLMEEYNYCLPTPVHLLGCSLPQEFKAYKANKFVESIDTSNPVVHGLYRIPYLADGLDSKLSIKLVDLFYRVPDDAELATIEYNCKIFRSFANNG